MYLGRHTAPVRFHRGQLEERTAASGMRCRPGFRRWLCGDGGRDNAENVQLSSCSQRPQQPYGMAIAKLVPMLDAGRLACLSSATRRGTH
jgi:hypothetical protein